MNMGMLLKYLAKTRDDKDLINTGNLLIERSKELDNLSGDFQTIRKSFLGFEGDSSGLYFKALSKVLASDIYSGTRTKQPPGDIFNAFLSYGYGILYSEVESACIISGLDPYFGFLHEDRWNRPSLTLDLVEEFRQPIVDRLVITLAARRQLTPDSVDSVPGGYYLNKRGRRLIVEFMSERLDSKINSISFRDHIQEQCNKVVKHIRGELRYTPFVWRWDQ